MILLDGPAAVKVWIDHIFKVIFDNHPDWETRDKSVDAYITCLYFS